MYKRQERYTFSITQEYKDKQLLQRLKDLAKKRRRSLNFVVLEALERYLKQEESKPQDVD